MTHQAHQYDRRKVAEASVRDHLANERTMLAWERTALTVVGIGFLMDRFATEDRDGLASLLGLGLCIFGAALALVGLVRFAVTAREIDTATYRPSVGIHAVVAVGVAISAGLVALYLVLMPS